MDARLEELPPHSHAAALFDLWHDHAPDEEYGAFHTALSREWAPVEPYEKIPAMVSRGVFAFAAAYQMTGDDRHFRQARRGADYLFEHAWDDEHGGWFDRLTREGEPAETTKSVPLQLYTNAGLTQYYMVTGDDRAIDRVRRSLEVRRTAARDEEHGGYYDALERDLSPADRGKNKHAHYGYVGSQGLNMYLATRDPDVLAWSRQLCDLSIERQTDEGWIYGFDSEFDRDWNRTPATADGQETVAVGAQLTAALAFLRLFLQSGAERYREWGVRLADNLHRHAWDERGFFPDRIVAATGDPAPGATVTRWVQIYGCFLQLQLYNLTEDPACLDRFRAAERFYLDEMVDREHGGVFPAVDFDGEPTGTHKAAPWKTAYHEVEHVLLAGLYRDLYVNGDPATLHFRLDGGDGGRTHYVSPVDDSRVGIEEVRVDGEPWDDFDADERSVTLPAGADRDVAVTLSPVPGR